MGDLNVAVRLRFKTTGAEDAHRAINGIIRAGNRASLDRATVERRVTNAIVADQRRQASAYARPTTAVRRIAAAEIERGNAAGRASRELEASARTQERSYLRVADAAKNAAREARGLYDVAGRNPPSWRRPFGGGFPPPRGGRGGTGGGATPTGGVGVSLPGALGPAAVVGAVMAFGAENQQRLEGWRNIQDPDAMMAQYLQVRQSLLSTSTNSGKGMQELEGVVRSGSQLGYAPESTAEMLATAQDVYTDQLNSIMEHSRIVFQYARAFGSSPEAIMAAGATAMRDLGVGGQDFDKALGAMAGSTQVGTVNVGQMTSAFGALPNLVKATWGDRASGMGGVQLFSALAQEAGRSGANTAPEQANAMENFLLELQNPETWKRAQRAGIRLTEGRGANQHLRDPRQVVEALMGSQLDRPGALQDVFHSEVSQRYVRGLRTGGMDYFDRLMAASNPEAGAELMQQNLTTKMADESGRALVDQGRHAMMVYDRGQQAYRTSRQQSGYISDWKVDMATQGIPSLVTAPVSALASAEEGGWGLIDRMFQGGLRQVAGFGTDMTMTQGLGTVAENMWGKLTGESFSDSTRTTVEDMIGRLIGDRRNETRDLLGGKRIGAPDELQGPSLRRDEETTRAIREQTTQLVQASSRQLRELERIGRSLPNVGEHEPGVP